MSKMHPSVAVLGMIVFGTTCSILAKIIYSVRAPSIYGGTGLFEKPWFEVLAMFAGMSVCILLDLPKRTESRQQQQNVYIIAIPAVLDLFATACGTTGLLYTSVSVYQMLRGAMLIWTALLSVVFLGRRLSAFNYGGIGLCTLGIAMVGLANVLGEDNGNKKGDSLFGITIIVLGQVLQAAQVVLEEFLLRNLNISSIRVVAWEGLFGIFHCFAWVLPIVYLLPGRDHGHLEDTFDSFFMATHSWTIASIVALDMVLMLLYNTFGMEVTNSLSAIHRVVIETLRTVCVWVIDLFIFYVLSGGKLGESWTQYSYLQLLGFSMLVGGTILYNYDTLFPSATTKRKVSEADPLLTPAETVAQVEHASVGVAARDVVMTTTTKPLSVGEDEDEYYEEGEEAEQVGSFYGQTVGSVAHSPYLVASATTPTAGSLCRRGGFSV